MLMLKMPHFCHSFKTAVQRRREKAYIFFFFILVTHSLPICTFTFLTQNRLKFERHVSQIGSQDGRYIADGNLCYRDLYI